MSSRVSSVSVTVSGTPDRILTPGAAYRLRNANRDGSP